MFAFKILLRKMMLYRRNKMCFQKCFEISEKIQKAVWETREWKSAGNINIYKSVKNEVSTRFLIHDAEKYSNKVIFYPTEKPTDNVIDVDLIIVPGLVFDERCARYGRGGGYYDRFLEKIPKKACIMGIAYDFQVLPYKWKLKLNEYDVKMDMIITEKRIIQRRGTVVYS